MGHTRLGDLARTRKWQEVINLIAAGAAASQVANAILQAAERGLNLGAEHAALVESFWILSQLPTAAREDNFAAALRDRGLSVPDNPGLMDIVGALSESIDARLPNNNGRTDLGELAQAAAAETVVQTVTERTQSLFGCTPADVQQGLAGLATEKQFGVFARQFYARLTEKVVQYYASRATCNEVGPGLRFATLASKAAFDQALSLHCREASRIVETFAGQWSGKTNWQQNDISREHARGFSHVALRKMTDELRAGAR